jgi:hypothetical protein
MISEDFAKMVQAHALPVPWLAQHVGHVSERTFRYWVSGRPGTVVTVPEDAVNRMKTLNTALNKALAPSR